MFIRPNVSSFSWIGKNWEDGKSQNLVLNCEKVGSTATDQHSKISVLNLCMNKEKLCTNLNQILHYLLKFKNLSTNWEKYVFYWKKWNFKSIGNTAYITKPLALAKALNKYVDYWIYIYWLFDVLPKQTTCEMKAFQVQLYIQQWFLEEKEVKFM